MIGDSDGGGRIPGSSEGGSGDEPNDAGAPGADAADARVTDAALSDHKDATVVDAGVDYCTYLKSCCADPDFPPARKAACDSTAAGGSSSQCADAYTTFQGSGYCG